MQLSYDLTGRNQYFLDIDFVPASQTLMAKFRPGNPLATSERLEDNLKKLLTLTIDGVEYNAANGMANGKVVWTLPSDKIENLVISLNKVNFATYRIDKNTAINIADTDLSGFELRMLARGTDGQITANLPHPRDTLTAYKPATDLHTHFAGNILVDDLIAVGIKNGTSYPASMLKEVGIEPSSSAERVKLADLSIDELNKLKMALAIPVDEQSTFRVMEKIYRMRSPITKDRNNFADFLGCIAQEYKKQGVQYAELSLSDITDPDYLKIAHETLPRLEQETGVKLRFLVGLWRHSEPAWNDYEIEKIKLVVEHSPYIVGVDFMGHETNSTYAFAPQLENLAKWSTEKFPDFIYRVHAGENPLFSENIRVAADIAEKHGLNLRIGHGLYGVDAELMAQLKRINAIIEFCLNSNMALNNVDAPDVPIRRYLANGVQVVLGQDGSGIYHTTNGMETLAAALAGVRDTEFQRIAKTEKDYIANQGKAFDQRCEDVLAFSIPAKEDYPSRVMAEMKAAEAEIAFREHVQRTTAQLEANGVKADAVAVNADIGNKTPIWISGASASSWPKIATEDQENIRIAMALLVDVVDPTKAYLITGGTNFGVEKELHALAQPKTADGLIVLGTLVDESRAQDIDKGTITHAQFVGRSWYDKSAAVLDAVNKKNGHVLFIGGGNILNDEIQSAYNSRANFHLMDGPSGASTTKAQIYPARAFSTAREMIVRLYEKDPSLFLTNKIKSLLRNDAAIISLPANEKRAAL